MKMEEGENLYETSARFRPARSIDRSLARSVRAWTPFIARPETKRGVDDATRSAKWNKFQPFDRFFYFLTVLSLSRFESDYNESWEKEMTHASSSYFDLERSDCFRVRD